MLVYLAGVGSRPYLLERSPLKVYLAGTTFYNGGMSLNDGGGFNCSLANRVNLLESFYYIADWQTRNLPHFKSFMLDSGAFTFAYGSGGNVDFNDYLVRYIEYINANDVSLFFELDIDEIVGYETVLEMRERLEDETGKRCIPVWHVSRGYEEWLKMCREYDYVAIGGIATKDGRAKLEKYLPKFTADAHKLNTRVHGLGYTNITNLSRAGFDSVDSSAWLYGNRGGFIYNWDGNTLRKIERGRLNAKAAARHNFMQWVLMAECLECCTK